MKTRCANNKFIGAAGFFFLISSLNVMAAPTQWNVSSPDGTIAVTISNNATLVYSITKNASAVLDSSPLGLDDFSGNLVFVSTQTAQVTDNVVLASGKSSSVAWPPLLN